MQRTLQKKDWSSERKSYNRSKFVSLSFFSPEFIGQNATEDNEAVFIKAALDLIPIEIELKTQFLWRHTHRMDIQGESVLLGMIQIQSNWMLKRR